MTYDPFLDDSEAPASTVVLQALALGAACVIAVAGAAAALGAISYRWLHNRIVAWHA